MPEGTVPDPPTVARATRLTTSRASRGAKVAIAGAAAAVIALGGLFLVGRQTVATDDAVVVARTVTVSAELSAKVQKVHVREHQRVERGTLLAELDPTMFDNALARARAELRGAEAQLAQADVRLSTIQKQRPMLVAAAAGDHAQAIALRHSLDAEVRRSEAQAALAAASLALAKQEEGRVVSLRKTGSVSPAEVEQASGKVATLEAELASANAQIAAAKMRRAAADSAERSAGGRASIVETSAEQAAAEADRALAAARVEEGRAAVARAEAELARTRIVAPTAGVVAHARLEEGMLVGPSAPLLSIVATDDVWIEARVKETDVARLRDGQPVVARVDALGSHDLHGRVEGVGAATLSRFAAIPTEATGAHFVRVTQRVPVRVRFDERPEGLRAGLSAAITVKVAP